LRLQNSLESSNACPRIPAESPRKPSSFPQYGKLFRDFSTLWKNIFHTVEKQAHFFHAMEKLSAIFPHNGKTLAVFSTQWKKFWGFFHTMEKMFPQCGKLGFRAVFGGFSGCSPGLLSGARGAP
jgi:hypothetical protein